MSEIILSPNHIQDTGYAFKTIVEETLTPHERSEAYNPQDDLPRPSYNLLSLKALNSGEASIDGKGLSLDPRGYGFLKGNDNLRVVVATRTRDARLVHVPGVVVSDAHGQPGIGLLKSDTITTGRKDARLTPMQQTLLDQLYIMHGSEPSHDNTPTNIAEIAHASVVASSDNPSSIHQNVHKLADAGQFAQAFTATGRLDIQSKKGTRRVRDQVVPAVQFPVIYVYPHHQLEQQSTSDLSLTAGELAVGLVLASAETRGLQVPVERNLLAIMGQAS